MNVRKYAPIVQVISDTLRFEDRIPDARELPALMAERAESKADEFGGPARCSASPTSGSSATTT
ncbi:MAG: hypothetical protein ABJC39_00315 [Chloroflexota bacterium]